MQGVAPTASCTGHAAHAAAAIPTCHHEGTPSAGDGPARAQEMPHGSTAALTSRAPPLTCKRLPQHPDLLGGRGGP